MPAPIGRAPSSQPVVKTSEPAAAPATHAPAAAPAPSGWTPRTPAEHRPAAASLWSSMPGQVGASPNQSGRITSAAELAQFVFAGYNGGTAGPISMVPATLRTGSTTQQVQLISLSGTEKTPGQATSALDDVLAAASMDSPALRNAKAVLMQLPPGTPVVLAGHSLGGMIAQQLTADPDLQHRLTFVKTIAFGAPPIDVGFRQGPVERITASGDPVALASPVGVAVGLARLATEALQKVLPDQLVRFVEGHSTGGAQGSLLDKHLKSYTDESLQVGKMDALGDQTGANAVLEFDPSQRRFFSSPEASTAPATGTWEEHLFGP